MSHDRAGLRTVHCMHWRNALSTTGRTCESRDLTRAGGTGFVLNANPCCDAVRGSDDSPRKTSLVDARIDAANPGYCLSSAALITCFLILRLAPRLRTAGVDRHVRGSHSAHAFTWATRSESMVEVSTRTSRRSRIFVTLSRMQLRTSISLLSRAYPYSETSSS